MINNKLKADADTYVFIIEYRNRGKVELLLYRLEVVVRW